MVKFNNDQKPAFLTFLLIDMLASWKYGICLVTMLSVRHCIRCTCSTLIVTTFTDVKLGEQVCYRSLFVQSLMCGVHALTHANETMLGLLLYRMAPCRRRSTGSETSTV